MCLKEDEIKMFQANHLYIRPSFHPSIYITDIFSADNLLLITQIHNWQRPAVSMQNGTREPLVHTCTHVA